MQEELDGNATDWLEKVSDDQYHSEKSSSGRLPGFAWTISICISFTKPSAMSTMLGGRWKGSFAEGKDDIFHNERLQSVGRKHGKSVAQVIFRWLIQRDIVAIPKSVHAMRIVENFDAFDFELDAEDMVSIAELDRRTSSFFDYRDPEIAKRLAGRRLDI